MITLKHLDPDQLQKAVENDTDDILLPVVKTVWSLQPASKFELVQIAQNINQKLGFELFKELGYTELIRDFSIVAKAVALNASKQK